MIPVTITAKAAEEIKHILSNKNIPEGYALRLLVEGGGGCGGARFRLGFDKPNADDEVYESEGVRVLYQKKDMMFLLGLSIDFEERSDERGFVFVKNNMN
ncbi:MAG: iron-sulfur cluster assembly accessory protein [Bernardetiaceae bacterium]|nr:iron-sulfur cluster assembly accessory protein [Bernardetiaceae bacterium]